MCGLIGIAGPGIISRDLDLFKQLGIVSQLRGTDSAGIFQTKTTGSVKSAEYLTDLYKSATSWVEILEDIEFQKKYYPDLMDNPNLDLVMGHLRAATRGKITKNNSHPFDTPRFVGAHNGTLVDGRYAHHDKTDSEMMFMDMDHRGIVNVLNSMDRNSAFAISVYEKSTRTMIFARNGKRPLWFVTLEDRPVLFWASEPAFITLVLNRAGVKYKKPEPFPEGIVARLTPHRVSNKDTLAGWTSIGELSYMKEERAVKDAAAELEKISTNAAFVHRANSSTAILPENQNKKEVTRPNPPHFVERNDALNDFRLKCGCGKQTLDIFHSHLCRIHTPGQPLYDIMSNTFECTSACKKA